MRKNLTMVLFSLILLSGVTALLSACDTIAGAGADVSNVGHAVTGGAEQATPR